MRKILLIVFLLSLTLNAYAKEEKWALVTFWISNSLGSSELKYVATFPDQKKCKKHLNFLHTMEPLDEELQYADEESLIWEGYENLYGKRSVIVLTSPNWTVVHTCFPISKALSAREIYNN